MIRFTMPDPALALSEQIRELRGQFDAFLRAPALLELFSAYSDDHFAWAKELWDITVPAFMINPEWFSTLLVPTPMVTELGHWAHDERRHRMLEAYGCDRNPILRDMFQKLAAFERR